jgi:hypothetical protein
VQTRLQRAGFEVIAPIRSFELTWLYSLEHWNLWLANLHQLRVFPTVLPGGELFALWSKHALGVYTIAREKSWGYLLDIQDDICDVIWEIDAEGWIRLVILLERDEGGLVNSHNFCSELM